MTCLTDSLASRLDGSLERVLVGRRGGLGVGFGLLVCMIFDKEGSFLLTLCVMSSIVTTMESAEPAETMSGSARPAMLMLAHRSVQELEWWKRVEVRRNYEDSEEGKRGSVTSE